MYRMSPLHTKTRIYKIFTMPKTVNTNCPFKCHSPNQKMLGMQNRLEMSKDR